MIKKIFKSFLPYLALLIGIFIAVIFLDAYAEKISDEPVIINIIATPSEEIRSIVEYETDDALFSISENSIRSDSIFVHAVNLYRSENYDQSKEFFEELQLRYSENPTLNNYLGLVFLKDKRFSNAQTYFSKAISLDPSFFAAYINLAVASSRMHQYRNAENAYRKAMKISPVNPKPYYNLGLLLSKTENWEKASAELVKSIELSSGDQKAKSMCYYGIARLNLHDTLTAKQSFNKAIEYKPKYQLPRIYLSLISSDKDSREVELSKVYRLNPNSFYANYYLGILYVEEEQHLKAEYHFRKALEINPDDEKIVEELSSFLINQQRFDEARLIIAGFAVHDTLPQSYFQEARLISKKGDIDDAILLYELAQKKSGNDYPEAALNQAILYKQKNDITKAIESYKKALQMKPDYAIAYYNLALLYQERGDIERAITNYKQALRHEPRSSKSWYNLAIIYDDQKQYDKAVEAFKKAIAAEPDYLRALSSLGVLYAKLAKYDQAIETYQVLVNHYPNYSRGFYNLGLAYNKTKKYNLAIAAYSKVIEIDPENIKAKSNIGVLYARTGNIELAIKTFEDAADMDVDNAEIRFNLGLQYEKSKQYNNAVYQYTMAIQLSENYIKAYDKLIELYKESGDSVNYYIVNFKKLKLNPDAEISYDLAKKLYKANEYKYALEAFNLALDAGTNRKWSTYWIGKINMDLMSFDEAIRYFAQVITLDPNHKFALYRIGQIFELKGLPDKAVYYFDRLQILDPDFKIVHKKKLNVSKKKSGNRKEKG